MFSIQECLKHAKEHGASDLLVTVGVPPKMRVDGKLISVNETPCTPQDTKDILNEVLPENQREKFEKNGACDFSFSIHKQGRYRVNAYKQRGSVALAFRLVSWEVPSPEECGVPSELLKLTNRKKGLILVSGPSGCGKSTTLACFLGRINENRNCHVITLEDPIEYLHQHNKAVINQREIGIDSVNYKQAMTDVLRENPDIIMVDELTDCESIASALLAAETGRLVVSAIYTKDVETTLERVVEMFPYEKQPQIRAQLSVNLTAVVSQQLLSGIESSPVVAFEVLMVDEKTGELIKEGEYELLSDRLNKREISDSRSMDDAILQLFYDGKIDRDVAVASSHNPSKMEEKI